MHIQPYQRRQPQSKRQREDSTKEETEKRSGHEVTNKGLSCSVNENDYSTAVLLGFLFRNVDDDDDEEEEDGNSGAVELMTSDGGSSSACRRAISNADTF